jgi:hypothetical protein
LKIFKKLFPNINKGVAMTDAAGNVIGHGQDWYEIEVEGSINPTWFDWPDGGEVIPLPNGNTLLYCRVKDQPALHGLFARIRDLNLKILFLKRSLNPQSSPAQWSKKQE